MEGHSHNLQTYRSFDPTHTTSLRNAFAREMKIKFTELVQMVKIAIIDRDCFGLSKTYLQVHQMNPPYYNQFDFPRSADKIKEFMKWLDDQVQKGIITVGEREQIGRSVESAWTNLYILDSYKRGIIRARMEMILAGMTIPSVEESGGIGAILMGTPFHMDRVGVLYTRLLSDLKGITDTMDSQISRILAQGMIDGDGPVLLARKIIAVINGQGVDRLGITDILGRFIPAARRAEMLARTELIRAFHLATIQEYRNWGVLNIQLQAEWKTAGDDRVCEKCASMDGKVMTLDEAEPLIPMHPMCRCIVLPWSEELVKYD